MRDMNLGHLCPVCTEALWENLLLSDGARAARASLIHAVQVHVHQLGGEKGEKVEEQQQRAGLSLPLAVTLTVATARLGAWRVAPSVAEVEHLTASLAPALSAATDAATAADGDADAVAGPLELRATAEQALALTLPLAQLLRVSCWRLRVRLRSARLRRIEATSSLCFCLSATTSSAGTVAGGVVARCVPCEDEDEADPRPAGRTERRGVAPTELLSGGLSGEA